MTDRDLHLIEHRVRRNLVHQGRFLTVYDDDIALPSAQPAKREYVDHSGSVMIVPILDDRRVVVERIFRYPVQRVEIEFPAGKIETGESPQLCAQRELEEETGFTARKWLPVGIFHNAAAYSSEKIHAFLATGLVAGTQKLDPTECIEVVTFTVEQLRELVANQEAADIKLSAALLWITLFLDQPHANWTSAIRPQGG